MGRAGGCLSSGAPRPAGAPGWAARLGESWSAHVPVIPNKCLILDMPAPSQVLHIYNFSVSVVKEKVMLGPWM